MLEEDILSLAAEEGWTAETIIGLLADFIQNEAKEHISCMEFLRGRTADAMIAAGL